ncbi:MAG TPA: ParA family protein [Saprospiraceae bacterium]|nr:ParA family protein [Saprospiraceae bacterium]
MVNIIAVANHKGGVGKTTSVQNIGVGLANLGKKILLVDLDPQANLSDAFGFEEVEVSIYDAMTDKAALPILKHSDHLDIIPSSLDLSVAEIELSAVTAREYVLKELLAPIADQYDFVIIDCPPSLGLLTINALTACTEVYIPLDAQYFSMKGLDKLMFIINQIKKRLNKEIDITGVFLTQFDSRIVVNRNVGDMIENYFPNKVFKTRIRRNVALVECPIEDKDIYRYAPNSNGAKDYLALSKEILKAHS